MVEIINWPTDTKVIVGKVVISLKAGNTVRTKGNMMIIESMIRAVEVVCLIDVMEDIIRYTDATLITMASGKNSSIIKIPVVITATEMPNTKIHPDLLWMLDPFFVDNATIPAMNPTDPIMT